MSVGDLIEGYTRDEAQIDAQWNEFQSFVANLKMPFFYVPGNHDLSNEMQHRKWAERFGRKYYHFVYRDVLFLCLEQRRPRPPHVGRAGRVRPEGAGGEQERPLDARLPAPAALGLRGPRRGDADRTRSRPAGSTWRSCCRRTSGSTPSSPGTSTTTRSTSATTDGTSCWRARAAASQLRGDAVRRVRPRHVGDDDRRRPDHGQPDARRASGTRTSTTAGVAQARGTRWSTPPAWSRSPIRRDRRDLRGAVTTQVKLVNDAERAADGRRPIPRQRSAPPGPVRDRRRPSAQLRQAGGRDGSTRGRPGSKVVEHRAGRCST